MKKKYYITFPIGKFNCPCCGKSFQWLTGVAVNQECNCFYSDDNGIVMMDKKHKMIGKSNRLEKV